MSSTSAFDVRFSRYKNGRTVISTPFRYQATSFEDSFKQANLIRYGMEQADKDGVYEIESIKQAGFLDATQASGYVFDLFKVDEDALEPSGVPSAKPCGLDTDNG